MMKNRQVGKNVEGDMIQDSIVIKNETHDILMKYLIAGDAEGAIELMKTQEKALGVIHPKYPYYSLGIKRVGDDLVPYSKPLSKQAIEKYPPKIKGKLSFGEKYKEFKGIKDLLDYSYRTQTEIEINKIELMKMIGDEADPYQNEIELLLSKTKEWKLTPQEFPKAKPYKIEIKGSGVSYDYILLRVIRIEDSKVFLSNRGQEVNTEFNFIFDLKNNEVNINIKINEDDKLENKILLKYLKFTKSALSNSKLSIIALESDTFLAEGIIDNFNYESPFGNIDYEINFVEYIVLIEKHYKTTIEIPKEIGEADLEAIYYLGKALKYGEIKGTWKDVIFNYKIVAESVGNIKKLEDKPFDLTFVESATVIIFEKEFLIPQVIRTFKDAQIRDLDVVKKKVAILENGDTIKVNVSASGDNQYTERFELTGNKGNTSSPR